MLTLRLSIPQAWNIYTGFGAILALWFMERYGLRSSLLWGFASQLLGVTLSWRGQPPGPWPCAARTSHVQPAGTAAHPVSPAVGFAKRSCPFRWNDGKRRLYLPATVLCLPDPQGLAPIMRRYACICAQLGVHEAYAVMYLSQALGALGQPLILNNIARIAGDWRASTVQPPVPHGRLMLPRNQALYMIYSMHIYVHVKCGSDHRWLESGSGRDHRGKETERDSYNRGKWTARGATEGRDTASRGQGDSRACRVTCSA